MAIPIASEMPQMPMGQAAMKPMDTSTIMPQVPIVKPPMLNAATPPAAAGLIGAGQPGGAVGFPAPGDPSQPPFDVKMQADGSSIYVTKGDPSVVIGVNPPPKIPKALQAPATPAK